MALTLDEAIERYTSNAEYERTHENLQGFLEFKQLAKWLRDYKKLLEREPTLDKIIAEIEQVKSIMNEEIINNNRKDLINFVNGLNQSLVIVDRYKAESEVQDGIDIS